MPIFLDRAFKILVYSLTFLLPLFFLPFTFEAFDFNKTYLLFFLTSLAFLIFLAKKVLIEKEIKIRLSLIDFAVLAFLGIAGLGVIFSADKVSSISGFYGRFADGGIALFSFGLFYFLIVGNISGIAKARSKTKEDNAIEAPKLLSRAGILKAFFLSSFIAVLASYFSIFGILQKIPFKMPSIFLSRLFNPVSATLEGLAVFVSIIAVILAGFIMSSKSLLGLKQSWRIVFLALSLGVLLFVGFKPAWIVFIAGLLFYLILALTQKLFRENVNRLLIPIFLVLFSLSAFVFNINLEKIVSFLPLGEKQSSVSGQFLKEAVLDQKTSWQVSLNAATDNIKNSLLGTGIGTWHYDFAKYKPAEFNQNNFWQFRFDRGGSHWAEVLGTAGFLGFLSYLFLIFVSFLAFWRLRRKIEVLPFLAVFFALIVSQIFYYQNTVLAFVFWIMLALGSAHFSSALDKPKWLRIPNEKTLSFKNLPEVGLILKSFFVIIVFGALALYYFGFAFYRADMLFVKAQGAADIDKGIVLMGKAASLNKFLPDYRMILARVYLNEALREMAKPREQVDVQGVFTKSALAVSYGKGDDKIKGAADISPNRVAVWETNAAVYSAIWRNVGDAGAWQWAVKSLEKAISLEPANPVFHAELGRLYSPSFQDIQNDPSGSEEKLKKAKGELDLAVKYKPDLLSALVEKSLALEKEGELLKAKENSQEAESKLALATKEMEDIVVKIEQGILPLSVDPFFNLGRIYFNSNRLDEAINRLTQAALLNPSHSNALYSLASAYQRKGDKDNARKIFERVLELNPGNVDVAQRLEELEEKTPEPKTLPKKK